MNSQDVILGMLLEGSKSGYDIKQKFQTVFSFFYDASYGTIYPTLGRMEKEGYITKESVVQEGKPNKNMYSITELGRKQFQQYLRSPVEEDVLRSDLLMRLFFGEHVDDEVAIGWLEKALEEKERLYNALSSGFKDSEHLMSPTQQISIEFGLRSYTTNIQFLKEGIEKLQKLKE